MQLYYLLIVVAVGDVKIMSSTVTVIFAVINYSAITWVANNYNIRTEPRFLNRTEPHSFWTESDFFKRPNQNQTEIKKIYSAHP